MNDWRKIDKDTIFKGNDENGNRYLSQFLSDYKKTFNPTDINAGCERCLIDYYNKLIKHLSIMGKEVKNNEYQLKLKYNGIPLAFGSPILVTNANINEKYARQLIKNHPRGVELFDKLPEDFQEEGYESLEDLGRKELDALAENLGLNPEDYKNKSLIIEAIAEKKEEVNKTSTVIED